MKLSESGLDPKSMAWLLVHEKRRHCRDIEIIDRDLRQLCKTYNFTLEDLPHIDEFIEVDGVTYD